MRRILMMAFRLFLKTPYYLIRIWWAGKHNNGSYDKSFAITKYATKKANRAGKVTIETHGIENLPKENGFMLYPNHQGMFDVLVFLESCPVPFGVVAKKEISNVIIVKQVISAMGSFCIDRKDIKQSMEIINKVAEEVKKGRNFLIFAEGTRSRKGNELLDFKGGSFKAATKTKCPIVPCALIDSFIPFDKKTCKPVTVKIIYLPAIYYEEYKGMKTVEIAQEVKRRIEEAILQYS